MLVIIILFISVCFLLSLVDHEEIGELDFSDIVSSKQSMFATLLTNEENMKVWSLISQVLCDETQSTVNQIYCAFLLFSTPGGDSKISRFAWCMWTEAVSRKMLQIQKYLDRCGQGLRRLLYGKQEQFLKFIEFNCFVLTFSLWTAMSTAPVSQVSCVKNPVQTRIFLGFNFTAALAVYRTAIIIIHVFIFFSTVQRYALSYIHLEHC